MPRSKNLDRISMAVEKLETRRLLSAALNSQGTLIVTGDPVTANTISVGISADGTSVSVAENSDPVQSFDLSQVNRVVIIGGAGNDTLTIDQTNAPFTLPNKIFGEAGDDSITGGGPREFISGGSGNDTIIAGDGTDSIKCGGGSDSAIGGTGHDSIFGGQGGDTLSSGGGSDYFNGGAGKDVITGGSGADTLDGGKGNNDLNGGSGQDFFVAGTGHNQINCGSGSDTVNGAGANDQVNSDNGGSVTNDDSAPPAMPSVPDKAPPTDVPNVTDVGTVTGSVSGPDGSPVSGATVFLCTINGEHDGFTLAGQFATTSDSTGSFSLSNIPAGKYIVLAGEAGVGFVNTTVTVQTGQTATLALGLQTLSGTSDSGTGSVSGQVTDSQNNPVVGATVKIVRESDDASGTSPGSMSGSCITTTTDSNGDYSFASVPGGTFDVVAFLAGSGEGESQTTIIADQAATTNITIMQHEQPQTGGTVSGTVVDSNDNPVASASVGLISSETGAPELYASTAADGTFSIADVSPGTYTFVAGKHGIGMVKVDDVSVTASQTTTEDVTLQSTVVNPVVGTVTGNVVLSDGVTPAVGAKVALILKTDLSTQGATRLDPTLTATTDNSGNFSVANVPAGEYFVYADLAGVGGAKGDITVTADSNTPVMLELSAPKHDGNGDNGNQASVGTVSGTVTNSNGNPVDDASVGLISNQAGSPVIGTSTDSNGNFTLTNVPVGTYTLASGKNGVGRGQATGVVVTASQTTMQNLTLTTSTDNSGSGGNQNNNNNPDQGSGTVSVTILDPNSHPLANASVGLISSVAGAAIIGGGTDVNGDLILNNVPDGTYTLEAGVHGIGRAQVIDVIVTNDQTTSEHLTLQAMV